MTEGSQAYQAAEIEMGVPPVATRGQKNGNPADIGFWALIGEDFRTHERKLFEQGFWAIAVHRFGNWRMDQPKIIRAPATLLYRIMFKLVEWFCGISLWYTIKLGRRVRLWHHSGMVLGARAIGDDVQLRQNTTLGVGQTGQNAALPILASGVDVGAGACIAGAVHIGEGAKIGANALVLTDVPAGATVMGNPAQIVSQPRSATAVAAPTSAATQKAVPPVKAEPAREVWRSARRDMGTLALLGSANLDVLATNINETATAIGLDIETFVPEFGQARMELLKPASESHLMQALCEGPAATLIVERAEDILGNVFAQPLSLDPAEHEAFLEEALAPLIQLITDARRNLPGPVLVMDLVQIGRSTLGLADKSAARGVQVLIAAANARLHAVCAQLDDVHMLDAGAMMSEVGQKAADPGTFWHMGRVPFSNVFGMYLARRTLGALLALRGATARIIVLDLDNTLWGGVLGEDGMEGLDIGGTYPGSAYTAFQTALKALTDRGIALAVASKNDEDLALRMINDHPEMVLRGTDIVAHRIGWTEKALGIADMLDEIGLGAGNAMFIDDNPVEREKVRKNIPEAIVPDFPADPADLAGWLLDNPYVECLELTASDLKRTKQYKVRAKVTAAKRDFSSIDEFYADLGMRLTFEPFGAGNQKRILQLFAKTNQFNATLRRHDAASVAALRDRGGEVFAIGVADRHSEYELMGVIVLMPDGLMQALHGSEGAVAAASEATGWWVESLLLSCRILGRTVEQAIVAWATNHLASRKPTAVLGQVIEAPRNTPVRDVFAKSGFDTWATGADRDLGLGAGGIYRHDMRKGPLAIPDYFTLLEAGAVIEVPQATAPVPPSAPKARAKTQTPLDPATETRLATVFRALFAMEDGADLETADMDSVAAWDSLGHLKLAMAVEQSLGLRLSPAQLGEITSYRDLRTALAVQNGQPA